MSWESLRLGQKTNHPNLEFKLVFFMFTADNRWLIRSSSAEIVINWAEANISMTHTERIYTYKEFKDCISYNIQDFLGLPINYNFRNRKKRSVNATINTPKRIYQINIKEDADIFEILDQAFNLN